MFLTLPLLPHNPCLKLHLSLDSYCITAVTLSAQVYRTTKCSSQMPSGWLKSVPLFLTPQFLSAEPFLLPSLHDALRADPTLPLMVELNYHHFHEVLGPPQTEAILFSPELV